MHICEETLYRVCYILCIGGLTRRKVHIEKRMCLRYIRDGGDNVCSPVVFKPPRHHHAYTDASGFTKTHNNVQLLAHNNCYNKPNYFNEHCKQVV